MALRNPVVFIISYITDYALGANGFKESCSIYNKLHNRLCFRGYNGFKESCSIYNKNNTK